MRYKEGSLFDLSRDSRTLIFVSELSLEHGNLPLQLVDVDQFRGVFEYLVAEGLYPFWDCYFSPKELSAPRSYQPKSWLSIHLRHEGVES